jgi:nucleotide-binding universal stress UspA family protein
VFKHILLPTDGSPLSELAVLNGIKFAKAINAKVTGMFVKPEFHVVTYKKEMLEETRAEFAEDTSAHAKQYLAFVEKAARDAGVACETASATSDHPYEAIINAARDRKCDLILMASHGRRGVKGLLLGSETLKVLTHSTTPVLVYR